MKANSQLVSICFSLLGFALLVVTTGCQQPYSYAPYAPYQQAPYGQPAYGQPMGPAGPGTIAPGSGTANSPISSVPTENNLQPTPGNGNNAPKFDPSKPNHSVPNPSNGPNSPYFEQSSSRVPNNTFIPETASSRISQAGLAKTASQDQTISLMAGEQPANFELPHRQNSKAIQPANPFTTPQEPQRIESNIPLAPPLAPKKTTASDNSLEGTVRKVSENNEWVLEFASSNDPFGGKLQLTGTDEVLKVLQDGRRFRLQGYIESPAANPTQSRFHIEQAQQLGSSFAPTK